MSQSAKSKALDGWKPQVFEADLEILHWYGWLRFLPLLAVVYVVSNLWVALALAPLLLLVWWLWTWRAHHRFILTNNTLEVHRPFGPIRHPLHNISLNELARAEIRIGQGWDQRQWLVLHFANQTQQQWRCDALHEQDPPDEDDHHDVPEHELFELLEEEDFYEGSLQHFAALLRQKGVPTAINWAA